MRIKREDLPSLQTVVMGLILGAVAGRLTRPPELYIPRLPGGGIDVAGISQLIDGYRRLAGDEQDPVKRSEYEGVKKKYERIREHKLWEDAIQSAHDCVEFLKRPDVQEAVRMLVRRAKGGTCATSPTAPPDYATP